MKRKLSYWFCTVTEQNGEYTYDSTFLVKVNSNQDNPPIQRILDKICDHFRPNPDIKSNHALRIPESDFNVLKNYLSILP